MIKTVKIFLIASLNMFFLCSCQTGHTDQSMAAQIIKHKQQDQDAAQRYMSDGISYVSKGSIDKAIASFSRALELDPENPFIYNFRGDAYLQKGQIEEAFSDFNRAIDLYSNNEFAYSGRGNAYMRKGQIDEAISDYNKAIALAPENVITYSYRGMAYARKGDIEGAISDFTRVLDLNPEDGTVLNNLAWILATCPDEKYRDGEKAIEYAEKLLNLKYTPESLDTLAAAYAEAGRFEDAVKSQKTAVYFLKLAGASKDLLDIFIEHLDSYEANKPWRENHQE